MESQTILLAQNDWLAITFRLGIASLFGASIGWDRETRNKAAGLRTHMLVSIGAAIFVLVPIQVGIAQITPDSLSRVIQGVITGIGFLGAGEIFRESRPESNKVRIRGLTSAAAVWLSAALGVVAACGLWQIGLISVLMVFLILRGLKIMKKIKFLSRFLD
ncbi:MAG: MgtC/SapB family protein [Prochloraceae cyanobacterium]|nr:MgtC/SapB family protein [Prochloraceae cyanobacterium]